jgi:hypothetical protein
MTNDPDKSSKRDLAPRYSDPFSALRAEMDNLFDSFMGGLPAFSGMFRTSREARDLLVHEISQGMHGNVQ